MSDWTAGYVADIGYTFGYYNELNPLWSNLALIEAGFVCPKYETACELGFGQGVSLNLHAAASSIEWHGNDFNPSQAGFAKSLARTYGSASNITDESFAKFCERGDLPNFDFICLHGIWSWISKENQEVVVDFLARKLNVGGVVYTGYNSNPGWASMMPMRNLLNEYCELMEPASRNIEEKIDSALSYVNRLLELDPKYIKDNPQVAERLGKMTDHQNSYLAHEYFNRDWHPVSFKEMNDCMAGAKLSHVGSANYLDHIDVINVNEKQSAFLKEIADPVFREQIRDMLLNQQFRKDYWIKGPIKLSTLDKAAEIRKQRVVLIKHPSEVELTVTGSLSQANLTAEIYHPILDSLASYQAKSLAEIEIDVKASGITLMQLLQAIFILLGKGALLPARDTTDIENSTNDYKALNTHIIELSRSYDRVSFLASPITGGGIPLERFKQLSLMAYLQGIESPQEITKYVWQTLAYQGRKISKEGRLLETEKENLDELLLLATEFLEKQLPMLKALKAIPD